MSGFLKKLAGLFSGSGGGASGPATEKMHMIGPYKVYATPKREGAQFRLVGRIELEADDNRMVRTFIRADLFSSEEDTVETTFRKAKQIIDQHGKGLFDDGASQRNV